MGFDANTKVEGIGPYNFRPFYDEDGPIPEPSQEAIGEYLGALDTLFRENRRSAEEFVERLQACKTTAERRVVDEEYAKWQEDSAADTQRRRRELLSKLCSGTPSVDTLEAIPGRLFDTFEAYVQEQLTPKAATSATSA